MTTGEAEMSLEQWLKSKWFGYTWKALLGAGGLVIAVGGSFSTWAISDTRSLADTAVSTVALVQKKQDERAIIGDNLAGKVDDLTASLGRLDDKVDVGNANIAEIRGIVMQMAREKTASRMIFGE